MAMCKNGTDAANVTPSEYNLNSSTLSHVVFDLFFLLYLIEIEMKESTLNIRPLRLLIRNPIRVYIATNTFQNIKRVFITSSLVAAIASAAYW